MNSANAVDFSYDPFDRRHVCPLISAGREASLRNTCRPATRGYRWTTRPFPS
jgi:hypothetical protein